MSAVEEVRRAWIRKGIVGHCPVCHHRDWEDHGEVALTTTNGAAVPFTVVALRCPNCAVVMMVTPPAE